MANNLRVFNTNSEYQSADLVHPAVSYVIETDKVIYEPTPPTPVFQGKWLATYANGHTSSAKCDSSTEIVQNEIREFLYIVSIEIGNCVTSIGYRAFYPFIYLTSVTIPNSVTTIGGEAFQSCSGLTSVVIPNSVTTIGGGAFYACSGLTSVVIPNSVTTIGNSAFYGCSSLTSIDIPTGVTSIGNSAFYQCTSLTGITVEAATPPQLEGVSWFFPATQFDNTNNCPIYVPDVDAYKSASKWSKYADRIFPIP